jgi:hypothetical protein
MLNKGLGINESGRPTMARTPVRVIVPLLVGGLAAKESGLFGGGGGLFGGAGNFNPQFVDTTMFKAAIPTQARQNLLGLLQNQGRTAPQFFERQITGALRGGEATSRGLQQDFARRGLQNSGLLAALQAATASGTQRQVGDIRANESFLAEQRKRQDLDLFNRIFLQPSIQLSGIASGVEGQNAAADVGQQQALMQLLGMLALGFGAGG